MSDDALLAQIEARRGDEAFMARLRERIEADKPILDRLHDGELCLREVEVTTATVSGPPARFLSDRPPDPHVLCLRPKPCDNPRHKPERPTHAG